MKTEHLTIRQQFQALPRDAKLVILHPSAYRDFRIFGQMVLAETNALYMHLPTNHTPAADVLSAVASTIAEQSEEVDAPPIPEEPADAAQRLADMLNKSSTELLYIDGYDGSVSEALDPVIPHIIYHLQDGKRIIVSGRRMPTSLLRSEYLAGQVALLPTDEQRMLVDYVHPEPGKTFLEVRAFGQGQVWVSGEPITRWEGYLPRALFFFFVDRAMTTRDEIFQTFWPNLSAREATNVFHVTKRKISEILGVSLTVYGSGFYRISPDIDLHYDVVNFQEAVQHAEISEDEEAERLYKIAIDLYREEFLSSIPAEWAVRRREEMRTTYTEALIGLARIYENSGKLEQALGHYLRASAVSSGREDLTRSIMQMYVDLGQPYLALDTYKRLEAILKRRFGVSPDPQTKQLMQNIKASLKK